MEIFLEEYQGKKLEFPVVIKGIQVFLEPVFDAIVNKEEWQGWWNIITKWKKTNKS